MDSANTVAPEINADELAPDTGKPVGKIDLARFGAGFVFFNVAFMTAGGIASSVLLPSRFNTLGIGKGETILGTMNSVSIIFALIANVIFGALSDALHSRFGKRTPWILLGAPVAALAYYMTSVSSTLVGIVGWWSLLQVGLNCMLAPCVAILSDRVPQRFRGTMSAFYGAGQIVGQSFGHHHRLSPDRHTKGRLRHRYGLLAVDRSDHRHPHAS